MNRLYRSYELGPRREEAGEANAGGGDPAPTAAEVAELREQLAAAQAERQEIEETARFWQEKASGKGKEPDADDKGGGKYDPSADIEEINSGGYSAIEKRFGEWAKKNKLMTQDEAQRSIQEATAIQAIAAKHPDLREQGSEFHKAFVKHAADLEGLPNAKRVALAAKLAEADLKASGKYREAESEEDRIARILASQGIPVRTKVNAEGGGLDAKGKDMLSAFGLDAKTFDKYSDIDYEFSQKAGDA